MMNTPRTGSRFTAPVLLVILLLLSGCGRSAAPESSASSAPAAAHGAGGVGVTTLVSADRSVVVTIDVSVTVDRVDDASSRLRTAVEQAGGFVSESQTSGTDNQQTAHLELRVPADKAKVVRATLGGLGEITRSTERVEDVTEQRADIEARLRSARAQEKRLVEIMTGKTTSIRDLVEMETEIARVRENVERLEAQERVTKSSIRLATVRVTFSTRTIPAWRTPGQSIVRAGKAGVQAASAISVCMGMMMAAVGPTLLPILALGAGIVVVVRRRRANAMARAVG